MTIEVTRDAPTFRPVTLRITQEDDLDKLLAVLSNVAENRIQHAPQIIKAAVELRSSLLEVINKDD